MMKRLAIIDIGSNSIRLVLVEIDSAGAFKIIDELKDSARLGADMTNGSILNRERIARAVDALKSFKSFCDAVKVQEIIAVATEAVRKAENGDAFIQLVKEETEIDIRILNGYEEAYYASFGVINSMYVDNSLIVDIGGSSTEIAWIQDNKIIECASLPIGAVNLTQQFGLEDMIGRSKEEELREYLVSVFKDIPWLFTARFKSIIGIGGTVRNIGKIDRKNKRYLLDIHHYYEMTAEDIHSIYNAAKSKNLRQRRKMEGLSKDRADIFVGPVCAVVTLMDLLNIKGFVVSGKGLREGLLYEYIINNYRDIGDVLDFSIMNVQLNHNVNREHSINVYGLSDKLFDKLSPIHHLGDSFKKILKTSAMLHDSGLSIRYYDHHKHSFYMILNSEINGLTHKELIMSAYTAAAHRNNDFDVNIFQYHSIINRMDLANVEKMGALLRIAESLDKSMAGAVTDIDCVIDERTVTLKVTSHSDTSLEIKDARNAAAYFYDVYERELTIT
jgi:exopolyphosphatase / guanosine-5'-triphosphate,3'-diphosphate pyrophosphatase